MIVDITEPIKSSCFHADVDDFVDVKAPDFNQFQQAATAILQTLQSKASKFHTFSVDFNTRYNLLRDQGVGGSNPLAPIH